MLSVNKTRVLAQNTQLQKTFTQQPALSTQTMPKDTVSFNGGMEKAVALTQTTKGKLGLAGLVLMTLFGVASTAKAHTLWANNGRPLAHEHQIPRNSSTSLYVDSHGNWSISTSQNGMKTVNHGGDQEVMKVGYNQWQQVRRVFDENDNQKFIKYGSVIKRSYPVDPQPGFRIPPHVKKHFRHMDEGQVIIITPPKHHRHHHHSDPYGIPGRDRAIERSFDIFN